MSTPKNLEDWEGKKGDKWANHVDGLEALLEPVNEPLLAALRPGPSDRIADIGCGGGGATIAARRTAPNAIVHGFDLAPRLVTLASQRLSKEAIDFHVADVATKSPPDGSYDRLMSRFGVMFFEDPNAAFRNLYPWLKPNGRFAFAVWGPPKTNPWITTVRQTVEPLIDLPPPAPNAPGLFRYASVDPLLEVLNKAGFCELEVNEWRGPLPIGGALPAKEAAHFALSAFHSLADLLKQAGNSAFEQAHDALTTRFQPLEVDGTTYADAHVHLVTGTRK